MLKKVVNAVRRNHALEHATISIMLTKDGPRRVVGRAAPDGFYIYANVATDRLREFADEALARLQHGEADLAVSPLCGTNIAVTGILAGCASFAALSLRRSRLDGLSSAIMAAMVAVVAAQPLGRLVQKRYTTSPDLAGVRIVSVEALGKTLSDVHKVHTAAA